MAPDGVSGVACRSHSSRHCHAGILIAFDLEQTVELFYLRQQVVEANETLAQEIRDIQEVLEK